ncbi:hypothetical protein [Teichococcus aestuarii]|uniref:hypothetical protein n=1 Tax=Teichococcus aestuarii TaxID=568898 RepID=UPI00360A94E7
MSGGPPWSLSSWRACASAPRLALASLLGVLGVQLAPEAWERVVSAGMTLADIVALLLPLLGQ